MARNTILDLRWLVPMRGEPMQHAVAWDSGSSYQLRSLCGVRGPFCHPQHCPGAERCSTCVELSRRVLAVLRNSGRDCPDVVSR